MKPTSKFLLITLVVVAGISLAAAKDNPDYTQFGRDIYVAPDQKTGELTCIGCSIHIRGQVASDVTTLGGDVVLDGDASVAGDITAIGGKVRLGAGTKVAGDLTSMGGKLIKDPQAQVAGDVATFDGQGWLFLIFGLPLLLFAGLIAFIVWLVQGRKRPVQPLARAA
jgi:hypothetical protein